MKYKKLVHIRNARRGPAASGKSSRAQQMNEIDCRMTDPGRMQTRTSTRARPVRSPSTCRRLSSRLRRAPPPGVCYKRWPLRRCGRRGAGRRRVLDRRPTAERSCGAAHACAAARCERAGTCGRNARACCARRPAPCIRRGQTLRGRTTPRRRGARATRLVCVCLRSGMTELCITPWRSIAPLLTQILGRVILGSTERACGASLNPADAIVLAIGDKQRCIVPPGT